MIPAADRLLILKKSIWIQTDFSDALTVPSVSLLHTVENYQFGQLICRNYHEYENILSGFPEAQQMLSKGAITMPGSATLTLLTHTLDMTLLSLWHYILSATYFLLQLLQYKFGFIAIVISLISCAIHFSMFTKIYTGVPQTETILLWPLFPGNTACS